MQQIDNKNLALLSQLIIKKRLTIAVAESCTAGLMQNTFSKAENAMAFFQGGITVYNSGQKAKQLNIDPIKAEECNSVSTEIAEKLALEVAVRFNAEIGIAVTGYAKPAPEINIINCYAYIAAAYNGKVIMSKKIRGDSGKDLGDNQILYVNKIMKALLGLKQLSK